MKLRNRQSQNRCYNHSSRRNGSGKAGKACSMALLASIMTLAASSSPPLAASSLDAKTQQVMVESIQDEYHAKAFYNAVIEKFGPVRPFINIVQAEERHAQRWVALFNQYGLPVPEDSFAGKIAAPATLSEACELAIAAEIANVKMYDGFLEFVTEPDLRTIFSQLRNVSENQHKVAFERCANRVPGEGQGQGQGRQGQGRQGQGRQGQGLGWRMR